MADVFDEYARLGRAFDSDGWKLLRSKYARIEVAMLNAAFPDRSKPVACDVMHANVHAMLTDFRERGYDSSDVPSGDGRAVCHDRWMNDLRLIEKIQLEDGTTQYRLRSSTIAALDAVRRMGSRDIMLSSPRIETITREIDKLAALVSGDFDEGRRLLVEQLEEAQRALDEFDAGGGAREVTPQEVEARLINVVDLLNQVPHDMRQIEEELKHERDSLFDEFHADARPHGQIVGEYLEKSDKLFNDTDGGKLYNGALEMFAADQFDTQMHHKVRRIARSYLLATSDVKKRYDIRAAWETVSDGMRAISAVRASCSRAIANAVGSYDQARYRKMTETLKRLESLMWERAVDGDGAGKGASLMDDLLPAPEIEALHRRLRGPAGYEPPPLLGPGGDPPAVDLRDLRQRGMPLTKEVIDAFEAMLAPGEARSAAQLFLDLPFDLRRDVEVLGLISSACAGELEIREAASDAYECIGADGVRRIWRAPKIMVRCSADVEEGVEDV